MKEKIMEWRGIFTTDCNFKTIKQSGYSFQGLTLQLMNERNFARNVKTIVGKIISGTHSSINSKIHEMFVSPSENVPVLGLHFQ